MVIVRCPDIMYFYLMMINCFCGMVDRRKTLSLIYIWDQRLLSEMLNIVISDTPRAGLEHALILSSGFVEGNCAVVITTTPRHHSLCFLCDG